MAAQFITNALVSPFVERTIDKLASRFVDTFRGKKHNKEQLTNLKLKLLALDVVTDDAEQKQFTDPRVREWLLSAKGVVFDAEDLLDQIDNALSKSQVEAQSQGATEKVFNFLKSSFFSFFKENEIETRIEQIIAVLKDLENRSHFLDLKKTVDVGFRTGSRLSSTSLSRLSSTSLSNESDIYGREHDKKFVFNWLTSDTRNNLSILSIVGMGGVGKTALAQHVFNDPRMDDAKFDVKAWVCVSEEFDVLKVSKAILERVTEHVNHDDTRDLEMVHKRLKKELMGKKFLLVLDDVWNENQSTWEEVRKPLIFGAQGSKILVTARSKEVASTMRSEEHSLEQLQEDDCWKLFAKHAFRDDDTQPNQECREIGMKIVKKCKGLPLALKTMGSLLFNKSSVSEWETVLQNEIWEFSKKSWDIIPSLALSYIHLPSHLKACFAYCALFSKDYEFRKKDLIQLWMTENLAHFHQQCKTPDEVCQQYFNDLLSRSFFQQLSEKKELFVMHDLLHDLAKYVGGGLYFRYEPHKTEKIQKKVTRHFSFEIGYPRWYDEFRTLCNTERLRTFVPKRSRYIKVWFRYCLWDMKMSIHELLSKFKNIRILSLSYYSNLEELPDSVANLEHLRSLDLSHTAIKRLTEKICSLLHLQILKLNYCGDLEELPSNLHSLTNLCRLEFKETKVRKVPTHLGKLKNLKVVMNLFKVGHGRELRIQNIGELNLEGSLLIEEVQNIENSLDALEADLKSKTLLMKLGLKWGRNSNDSKKDEEVIDNLQPSKNLKKLFIYGYGGKRFPKWLLENSLWNMTSLVLYECDSCQCLPPLGLLPLLKVLKIDKLDGIVIIDGGFHGNNSCSFKSLEKLEFSDMSSWEEWECQAVIGAFPCLRKLSIVNCPKLKGQLPEKVVSLEKLEIEDCQQLEASAPKALDVELDNCGKLQLNWGTMKGLKMCGDNMEASLQEIVESNTLESLEIYSHSMSDDRVSLWTFPLDLFPTLRTLHLRGFDKLQMISQCLIHNHLEEMTLQYCPKFESLSGSMHMLLPSLRSLSIRHCPRLESFPDRGLPSNLKTLKIIKCSKLVGSLKRAFGDSPSLERLEIEEVDAECFLDEGSLPLSLTSLTISNCPNLKTLDCIHQLSSLMMLNLTKCRNLQRLPEEGLPKSVSDLSIHDCPWLEPRCHKEGGEDWEKIAHIQQLHIW